MAVFMSDFMVKYSSFGFWIVFVFSHEMELPSWYVKEYPFACSIFRQCRLFSRRDKSTSLDPEDKLITTSIKKEGASGESALAPTPMR